jgi:hypothetical protein
MNNPLSTLDYFIETRAAEIQREIKKMAEAARRSIGQRARREREAALRKASK